MPENGILGLDAATDARALVGKPRDQLTVLRHSIRIGANPQSRVAAFDLLCELLARRRVNAGRPKGSKNVMSREFKEAILYAAAESQHAKDNGGGLKGYCTYLANEWPELFVKLLAKLLVLQEKERAQAARESDQRVTPAAYRTAAAEYRAALIAQGIAVHPIDEGTPSSNVIDGPFKKQER